MSALKKDEFFTVTRGVPYYATHGQTCYNRGYDGFVFQAGEVSDTCVAAIVIAPKPTAYQLLTHVTHRPGDRISMSFAEIVFQKVSQDYVDVMLAQPEPPKAIVVEPEPKKSWWGRLWFNLWD